MSTRPKTENHRSLAAVLKWLRDCDPATKAMLLLVAIALVRGILYALINPPLSAPDEKGHYDYLASLYESGGRSVAGEEAKQPPLYYWLSLPIFAIFAENTSDLAIYALVAEKFSLLSMYAVRIFSALLTVATVPIAYWTAKSVLPQDSFVCLGTAAFVALVPGYGWLGASISNDNLARLLAAGMILLLFRGIARGFSPLLITGLAGMTVAGVFTKPTTWPIAVVISVVLLARALPSHLRCRAIAGVAVSVALAAVVVFASPIGSMVLVPLDAALRKGMGPGYLSTERLSTFARTLDVSPFVYQFKTFWGSFSIDSIPLPSPVYWLLAALCVAACLGMIRRFAQVIMPARNRSEQEGAVRSSQAQILTLVILVMLEWMLSFVRYYGMQPLVDPSQRIQGWEDDFALMQGRFLFPVMGPIGFLVTWGLGALIPPSWVNKATWILVALLLAVDWIALITLTYGGHSWRVYPG